MADEYVLRMNRETAGIVARACEFYSRIRCGQFEEVRWLTVSPSGDNDPTFGERLERCSSALLEAKRAAFPEFRSPYSESYGIGHFRDSDTAWNVYQTVRYVIAWHEHPEGGITVNFDRPLNIGGAPMPSCEVFTNGKRDGKSKQRGQTWHADGEATLPKGLASHSTNRQGRS